MTIARQDYFVDPQRISRITRPFVLALTMIFLVLTSQAQTGKGTITGVVKDSVGAPLSHVSVLLKGTGKGTITNDAGEYTLKNVPEGKNILIIRSTSHKTVEEQVAVIAGQTTAVPAIQLQQAVRQLDAIEIQSERTGYKATSVSQSLRLQTPILETPQNIQVVTKEVIRDQQIFDMHEGMTRNVSGAQRIVHWESYARINMRGGQLTAFRNGMNAQINPWSPLTEDMSMVERIEFVKGPAGFMLSTGEPSGFYNVVTKKPSGIEKGEVTITLGSYETYRTTVDLDGKLSKNGKLLYRFNAMGQMKGSHVNFAYNNRYSFAPVLKYLVDDKTAVTLEYNQQYFQTNTIGGTYAFSKHKYADLPRSFTSAEPNLDPTVVNDKSVLVILEHQINDQWKFTAQGGYIHHRQRGQSMWPTGNVFTVDNDSLAKRWINIWDALGMNRSGQMFLNGNVNTGNIHHAILTGIDLKFSDYYADWNQGYTFDSTFNVYKPTYGGIILPEWDRSKDLRETGARYSYSYNAFYLQDELGFFDNRLRITLAGRYTRNKAYNVYSVQTNNSKFTPRAGVSYSVNKATSAYFVYDESFMENPGTDWQGKKFDPLTGQNIEFGVKRNWMDENWTSSLAVYQITKNNVLVSDTEHTQGGTFFSRQSGQQQIKGVELDVRGKILNNLEVVINYAYTNAEITEDTEPQFVGNTVPGTSKHIQNTWVTYRFGEGTALNGLKASIGYQYLVGRVAGLVYDKSVNELPDYFRLDGSIGYQTNKISLNLIVNNILDEYLFTGGVSTGVYYWQSEPGCNFRLTAGYRF